MASITRIKYIVRILVSSLLGLYIGMLVLLNIPYVQGRLASFISQELESLLKTEVHVGHVDLGLLNRLIIEDILLKDQQKEVILKVNRLSAKFDILPLLEKRLRISSVQLFGFNIHLNRETPESIPNYQFLLEALASKDTVKTPSHLDLRINTLLVRRGKVTYDVRSVPKTPEKFNASHISIDNLAMTLSLKALRNDTLNMAIRRLSFKEQSGFELKKVALKAITTQNTLNVNDFILELPNSTLQMGNMAVQYDSLFSILQLTDQIQYQGKLDGKIQLTDFAPIVPSLAKLNQPIDLSLDFYGMGKYIECTTFTLNDNKYLDMRGRGSADNRKASPSFNGEITRLYINKEGIDYLFNGLTGKVPSIAERLQFIDFTGHTQGNLNHLISEGILQTSAGKLRADITMQTDESHKRSYSGTLASNELDLGILTGDAKKFGIADFNIALNGFNYRHKYPETSIQGIISSVEYSNYRYENITMDGLYKDGGFNGQLTIDDENGVVLINGTFNTAQPVPDFNLTATVNNLRPHELNLSDKYQNTDISLKLTADFTGSSIENMNGRIQLDSLILNAPDNQGYFMNRLTITSGQVNGEKELSIRSPFMNALIQGNFSYHTLPTSVLHIIRQYIPSLITLDDSPKTLDNNFRFDIRMNNTELFEKVFLLPIRMDMPSTLKGYFNDKDQHLKVEGFFPRFMYNGTLYESASLFCENPSNQFNCLLRGSMLMKSGAMLNLSLEAKAKEDQLSTLLNWGNNTNVTYGGKVNAITRFSKTEGPSPLLRADVDILPTTMVLNDTIWHIHPSHIALDSGFVSVDNFLIGRTDQHLRIDGKFTDLETDSCMVDLKNVNVKYILDILKFDDVEFGGMATGQVNLKNLLKSPSIQTHLDVQNFSLNKALLGNADIYGHWDNELGGIRLDAQIKEKNTNTHVTGYVSPKLKGLDLNIEADSMNLAFITPFVEGIFSEIEARADGHFRLYGPFKFLDFEGDVRARFDAKIDVLNTYFQIQDDSIHIKSGELAFENIRIYDREGHSGILNGYLRHKKLKNMTYRFDVNADNLLVYDSDDMGDMSLYGRVYAIGDISVYGGNNTMNIDVALTTGPNTSFTYVSGVTTEATSNQFITFVDKTPKRIQDMVVTEFYHYSDAQKKKEEDGPPMDLYINMMIDATPNAQMKVIMDPVAGDHISARGNGNLQVNYYNKGSFRMFGNYIIDQGVYKLSMQEVIRKDFNLQEGGTISFSGDPYLANLDLQAVYTVNSASLSDLSTDATLNQSTVKVNCIMNLTGSLANPTIKFDLDLPTVSEEDRELVRSATSTEEQMNTQIIYLLTIGKFYTVDYSNNANRSSNATSSLAFNTLSGQLNNMLSQWTENKNWNIGANLSTGQEGWSDVEAEAILSGRLLNNRLLINGNFGYRENVLANTNFVGDFEAIWLLDKNGNFRLRGYNQTNDRYFTKSTLTTQGIGFIYKKDFDKWSELFHWFFKNRKTKKDEKKDKE